MDGGLLHGQPRCAAIWGWEYGDCTRTADHGQAESSVGLLLWQIMTVSTKRGEIVAVSNGGFVAGR